MKFVIVLSFLFSTLAFAQRPPGMMCTFDNGYFRVYDGMQKHEKYIGGSSGTVECSREFGALVTGSKFVTYQKGSFNEKYVGGNGARVFNVRGRLAVAVMGSYLIVAKAGGSILEKYISSSSTPFLDLSSTVAILNVGSYILASDGNEIVEKYVGSTDNPILSAGRELGAAIVGSYLVVYNNGTIVDKYIGSRNANDSMAGGRSKVIAASIGDRFVIYDGFRSQFQEYYVGDPGRVEVREDGAYHITQSGRITRYNMMSGSFDRR